jgi:putative ABC transport system permease protein
MEILLVALNSLRANKLRSVLTIVGIVVGIFSIIAISTIVSVLQNSIEDGTSQLSKTTFQIQKYPVQIGGGHNQRAKFRNRKNLTIEEYFKLKEKLEGIARAVGAEQWNYGKLFSYGNKETNPNIQLAGCTPEAFPNNQWVAEIGRSFNNNDVQRYENVVVLGATLSKTLFEDVDPIGEEIKVDNHKLRVIGVFEKQGSSFGNDPDNFAAIPITTYQNYYGKRGRSLNITVSSFSKKDYDDVI